jgi:hypothetical protein
MRAANFNPGLFFAEANLADQNPAEYHHQRLQWQSHGCPILVELWSAVNNNDTTDTTDHSPKWAGVGSIVVFHVPKPQSLVSHSFSTASASAIFLLAPLWLTILLAFH